MKTESQTLSIVVAAADNNVIGNQGAMPWHVSGDLKNFKSITTGKPIIMGRKTFESIGRPLPGRRNIVVTRNSGWQSDGVDVAATLEGALALTGDAPEIMFIGGGDIYAQALPLATRVYLTRVHAEPEGDTWFPILSDLEWKQSSRTELPSGPKDTAMATFQVFDRIL